jgi:hypothetical protein
MEKLKKVFPRESVPEGATANYGANKKLPAEAGGDKRETARVGDDLLTLLQTSFLVSQ